MRMEYWSFLSLLRASRWFPGKVRWSWKIGQVAKVYSTDRGGIRDDDETAIHRGVQGEGGAGSAARGQDDPGDRHVRHKVHPNQVSTWKQRAVEGMREVFTKGAERSRGEHEGEMRDLHAKIGELTVERDFLAKGLKW